MIDYLKKRILNTYLDLRLKRFKDEQTYNFPQRMQQIKNILLIVPPGQEYGEITQTFASSLYQIFKDVKVSLFERQNFRPTDGNWFGLPRETYLKNFQDEKFDLIIDLNRQPDKLCTYISILTKADLRLSISDDRRYENIYNLNFRATVTDSLQNRMENVLNYFRTFQKAGEKSNLSNSR